MEVIVLLLKNCSEMEYKDNVLAPSLLFETVHCIWGYLESP